MATRRTIIYISGHSAQPESTAEALRQAVEHRGDVVAGTFIEHVAPGTRQGRQAGWKTLLANLDGVDQVVVQSAADLPGRTIKDLLAILGRLRDHGVDLLLVAEGIDTAEGSAFILLDLVASYRRAKLSQAIRAGQHKALAAGKKIGRPEVPASLRRRIRSALSDGAGIRPTARRFGVSPSTVQNLRAAMVSPDAEAA